MSPLCNGNVGPNAPLANLIARVLRCVRNGIHETVPIKVLSSEEVLHSIQNFNKESSEIRRQQPGRGCKVPNMQSDNIVIGSMDVTGLYPNCKVAQTTKKVEE